MLVSEVPATEAQYEVRPGDWLSRIANTHGLDWKRLYAANRKTIGPDPHLIYPGQVLTLAEGKLQPKERSSRAGSAVRPSSAAGKAVAYARAQIGSPYLWGGNGPDRFDCSGLTSAAWRAAGVTIPRTADAQWKGLPRVPLSQLRPGDLVAFGYSSSYADHIGIYAGNGQLIDTSSHRAGGGVGMQSLKSRAGGGSWHALGAVRPQSAGSVSTKNRSNPPASTPRAAARQVFGGSYACAAALIQRESGWRVNATNPSSGAYGLPQALPGSKMAAAGPDWRTNPVTQLRWMRTYVDQRYGGICNALAFQQRNGWY